MYTQAFLIVIAPIIFYFRYSDFLNKILAWFLMLAAFLFISLNEFNNDIEGYREIFINPYNYAEIGYGFLVDALKFLGATDHSAVLFFYGLLIFILFVNVLQFEKSARLFPFAYLLFLLPLDITQVRFAIASSLVMLCLVCYRNFSPIVAFVILLVSVSIHYFSALLVVVFIFSIYFKKNVLPITIAGFIFNIFFIKYVSLYFDAFGFDLRTLHNYISNEIKISSLFIWGGAVSINILLIQRFARKISNDNLICFNNVDLMLRFSIYSLMMLPGLIYMFEFNRVYRFVLFELVFASLILANYLKKPYDSKLALSVVAIHFILGIYYSYELDFDKIIWSFL